MVSSLVLLQMWVTEESLCSEEIHPGVSWTNQTLEACSRGFRTLKNPRHGATEVHRCSDYVMHYQPVWVVMHLIIVMANRLFSTPHVISLIV